MEPEVQTPCDAVKDLQHRIDIAIKRWMITELPQWVIPQTDPYSLGVLARKVEVRLRELNPQLGETPGYLWTLVAGVDMSRRGRLFFASEVTALAPAGHTTGGEKGQP